MIATELSGSFGARIQESDIDEIINANFKDQRPRRPRQQAEESHRKWIRTLNANPDRYRVRLIKTCGDPDCHACQHIPVVPTQV